MNNRKGMSQVLALIVAAAVLMMTALTVIFLTQGSLGDFGQDTRGSACINTIKTQCQVQGNSGSVDVPGSCYADGSSGAKTQSFQSTFGDAGNTVDCTTLASGSSDGSNGIN